MKQVAITELIHASGDDIIDSVWSTVGDVIKNAANSSVCASVWMAVDIEVWESVGSSLHRLLETNVKSRDV